MDAINVHTDAVENDGESNDNEYCLRRTDAVETPLGRNYMYVVCPDPHTYAVSFVLDGVDSLKDEFVPLEMLSVALLHVAAAVVASKVQQQHSEKSHSEELYAALRKVLEAVGNGALAYIDDMNSAAMA